MEKESDFKQPKEPYKTIVFRKSAPHRDTRGKLRRIKRFQVNFIATNSELVYTAYANSLSEVQPFSKDFLNQNPGGKLEIYTSSDSNL